MNALRVTFGVLYAVIIAILLLLLIKCDPEPEQFTHDPEPPVLPDTIAEPDDLVEDIIGETGDRGALKITLVWDEECDVDLHVIEPDDTHIYFGNRQPGGEGHGYLDHDNIPGGPRSMENVYWDEPMSGTYRWYIKLFSCSDTHPNVPCTVIVFKNGREDSRYTHTLTREGEEHNFDNIVID